MQAQPAGDDLEAAVDAAIAACDGNVRATIRALIVSNSFLHIAGQGEMLLPITGKKKEVAKEAKPAARRKAG
jgi:hypothetical protein